MMIALVLAVAVAGGWLVGLLTGLQIGWTWGFWRGAASGLQLWRQYRRYCDDADKLTLIVLGCIRRAGEARGVWM